jgi:hypothetical protein
MLQVKITSSTRMSCRCLNNMWVYLYNARALLHARCVLVFIYSRPSEVRGMHGSARALLSREVGFRAKGCVVVREPSSAVRWDLEPRDAWQHRSPSLQ